MTIQKLINELKETGYKQYSTSTTEIQTKYLLQKRVKNKAVCDLNDRLCIILQIYDTTFPQSVNIKSVEVEIVAEKREQWWKLLCYSISLDECLDKLPQIEQTLVKLFNLLDEEYMQI